MSLIPIFTNNPRNHFHDPFTIDIHDPFHSHITNTTPFIGGTHTRVEWHETPEAHVLSAEFPGFKKEEVKVKVQGGRVLKISAKKEVKKEEKHENWSHFEHSQGSFSSSHSLPENSRPDHIRSFLENGVLIVTVPKRDVEKSHVEDIHVMG